MSKIPLPPPPGFRLRQLPKTSGGFRSVYPYAKKVKYRSVEQLRQRHGLLYDTHEDYWAEKAQKMHAALLHAVRTKLRQTSDAFKHLPEGWHWKRDDTQQRMLFQRVEDEYFREVHFRSPLACVEDHLLWGGGPYFMKLDIADAFGSVSYRDFVQFTNDDWFRRGWDHPREIPLAGRIYHGWPFFHPREGGLIQGAPTSPYLFERYCLISGLDDWLLTYSWANRFTVTRYVDDIVISSSRPFGSKVRGTLRRVLETEWGFRLQPTKSGTIDTDRHPLEFLGVSYFRSEVAPNRKFWRGVELHGMTKGRKRWLDQVMALNDLNVVSRSKKKRRAA